MFERLAPEIFNGLMLGAFYAAIAIGLSLIMNLTGTINMAHGSFLTLGGYLAYTLISKGTSFWFALLVAPILTALVGIIVERLLMRPLYRRDPVYSLLLTFGLSLIAEEVYRLIWGSNGVPFGIPPSLSGGIAVADFQVPKIQILIATVLALALALLWFFLNQTRVGLRLRAAVQDAEMIAALGTNTQVLYMVNFALGIFLAGLAGVLAGAQLGLNPTSGNALLMPAFVTVIVGGMGSLLGAIAGGLLIGLTVSMMTLFFPAFSEVAIYVLMALILLIRPRGLFGEEGIFG
ncbi:MAG TPA: branched-chain amino acid ABC transporter permease [Candidatus Baltobacteraceae bacterium]|jgi:branched-chain amino acid transport system permease protein|nr:branched-chain amino acid ABC transporter permease [Candidatus Baltobacteraceae bacterium]